MSYRMFKKLMLIVSLMMLGFYSGLSFGSTPSSLDELLDFVKQGKVHENKDNKARENKFRKAKANQKNLLAEENRARNRQEKQSLALETTHRKNDAEIKKLSVKLRERMGSLKELFGVIQQVAGDTRGLFDASLVSAEFPGREVFLDEFIEKMTSDSELASLQDMERLWFELQREMTESGKVSRFDSNVIFANGKEEQKQVIRVGAFNLISNGQYLSYSPETEKIVVLPRQPRREYVAAAESFSNASEGHNLFGLDPSRGQILKLLMQSPDLEERVHQGGTVGYAILALGAVAFVITLIKLTGLFWVKAKLMAQVRNDVPSNDNPLGRVLQVYEDNPKVDCETLELKLTEAILKERPSIERFTTLLKIIAAIAPLMGLLGTVIGMINTFQAITLFGTGDPKLMAGGISQALVTTVLGLVVAIPTVLLHALVHGQSRSIMNLLEMETAGIVAEHREKDQDVVA